LGVDLSEGLWNGHFLENRDAENLEDLEERRFQFMAFFNYGNKHVNRDGHPDLSLHGILAGPVKDLDPQVLLDPLKRLNDILPINNALLKLRSTTITIPCVHIASQWSGCTLFMTRSTMWYGGLMAGHWQYRPG
jgi:hypothetical protein